MRFLQSLNNPFSATPFRISLSNTQYLEWENSREPEPEQRRSGDDPAPMSMLEEGNGECCK